MKFKKEGDFLGKTALLAEKEAGIPEQVCFFKLDGRRIGRPGTPVLDPSGKEVGTVLSGTYSPVLEQPIGSALVRTSALEAGGLLLDLRGNRSPLIPAKPPLHRS